MQCEALSLLHCGSLLKATLYDDPKGSVAVEDNNDIEEYTYATMG
jgi:hypothetical protein